MPRRILLIKCGALGDVLRTTALLPPLLRGRPDTEIWWLTERSARPLLENNPSIERIVETGPEGFARLAGVDFDRVLSMEEDPVCAGLQRTLAHRSWTGVVLRNDALSYTPDSAPYYDMSLLNRDPDGGHAAADALKRANRMSYEKIWTKILGLPASEPAPLLVLTPRERAQGKAVARELGLNRLPLRVGIHPGAGARWPAKRIPGGKVLEIARGIRKRWGVPALLLGGPEERSEHLKLAAAAGESLIDAGTEHSLRGFAAVTGLCDVVVSADTLTLHISRALGIAVVAAFGPTSAHEISLPRGVNLTPAETCECFYRPRCARSSPCLGEIETERWLEAIARLRPSGSASAETRPTFSEASWLGSPASRRAERSA